MKRAWTKKVKAINTYAAGNDALEGNFKPAQPKVKRRVRTSVTMIGLLISMGAPNLLLTRQSDRAPAAEPISNEPTVSTVPAAEEANQGGSINSVKPEAVRSVPVAASSFAVLPPNPQVQIKTAVSTPTLPVVENREQKQQTLKKLPQKYQVDAASASPVVGIPSYNSLPKHPEITEKALETRRMNELVQKLKASKTERLVSSYEINRSSLTPPVATAVSEQLKSREVTGEVDSGLTAKQRILINRLKQKSNRRESVKHSYFEKEQSTNGTSLAFPVKEAGVGQRSAQRSPEATKLSESTVFNLESPAMSQAAVVVPTLPNSQAQSNNGASLESSVMGAGVGQHPAQRLPEVTKPSESTVFNLESPAMSQATVVAPTVPNSQAQSNNGASLDSSVMGAGVGQHPAQRLPEVTTLSESTVFNLESPAMPQAAVVVPTVVPNSQAQSNNGASLESSVMGAGVGQHPVQRSPEVTTLSENASLDAQKSQQTLEDAFVVSNESKSTVDETTVAVTSVSADYQVRPGDTLSAIARHHGVSLSELVNANQITDPDQLLIDQRLRIPTLQYSSGGAQTNSLDAVLDARQLQQTAEATVVIPDMPKPAGNEQTVAVTSVLLDYQARPGDTISAIARRHGISLSELVDANQITDPDRLLINQGLRIPTLRYSSTVGQTIAVSKRSTHLEATASTAAVPIPPEPLAGTPSLISAYSGMGGSISDETTQLSNPPTFEETQLPKLTTATGLQSNPYVQDLRTDIQRLQQKYNAQHTSDRVEPVVSETSTVAASLGVPASTTTNNHTKAIERQFRPNLPANQPINPEFRLAQAAGTLQPAAQNRTPTAANSAIPSRDKARVATAPFSGDASESLESLRGRQVSPELPPLGAIDTYLLKPSSAPFKGYIWPTKGVLTSGYGWRWGRMHKGIDVAAPIGTPVVAAAPGVVVRAGWNSGGYGKLVDIRHADGTLTRYAHNNRILVQAGQEVEQGQRISEMGNTGFSTGPHLHFEVHPAGKGAANPIAFLPGRR